MKFPTIFSLFLVLLTFQVNGFSQINKGTFIIDGGFSSEIRTYNHSFLYHHSELKEQSLNFNASISYFVSDKFVVGGGITTFNNTSYLEYSGHSLSTHVRYYLSNKNNKAFFVENHLGYNAINELIFFSGDIGLGLDYFLSPSVALEGILAFNYSKELTSDQSPYGRPESYQSTNAIIGMGLKFFLNRELSKKAGNQTTRLQKGTILLGTTSDGLSFSSTNDYSELLINLNPNFGKFIHKNWMFGAALNLDYKKESYPTNSFYNRSHFEIGVAPFIRFYQSTKKGRIVPFYEVGGAISHLGYIINTSTSPFPDAEEGTNSEKIKFTNTAFFGGLGLNLFVSPNVALELKGTYKQRKSSNDFKDVNLGLNLGLQYFIGK